MQTSSREVYSSQRGTHPKLAKVVLRHQQSTWQKPLQAVDLPALALLDRTLEAQTNRNRPLILDAFCGTGQSTIQLAHAHPDALVLGVDQSAQRLERSRAKPDNCLLLHAHCEAVWRHLAARGVRLTAHHLLYPNPWPKPGHLGRRVHGHPAFPLLLELGGTLELRSNWQLYVEEFGVALHMLGHCARIAVVDDDVAPMTLFERKYRDSGHQLWSLKAILGHPSAN